VPASSPSHTDIGFFGCVLPEGQRPGPNAKLLQGAYLINDQRNKRKI